MLKCKEASDFIASDDTASTDSVKRTHKTNRPQCERRVAEPHSPGLLPGQPVVTVAPVSGVS